MKRAREGPGALIWRIFCQETSLDRAYWLANIIKVCYVNKQWPLGMGSSTPHHREWHHAATRDGAACRRSSVTLCRMQHPAFTTHN